MLLPSKKYQAAQKIFLDLETQYPCLEGGRHLDWCNCINCAFVYAVADMRVAAIDGSEQSDY